MIPLLDVVEVRPLDGHRLWLRFEDGVEGATDLDEWVRFRGVFEPLNDLEEFRKVRVDPELGTIVWPTGADLDPVVLYSKVTGIPIDESSSVAEETPPYDHP